MEELLWIIVLVITVWIIWKAIKKRKKREASRNSSCHSLPSRIVVGPSATKPKNKRSSVSTVQTPLPTRSTRTRNQAVVLGPRGITPVQFPCCPIDKERNERGKPQKIFWDAAAQCYYCSRGHRFQQNGKIILP